MGEGACSSESACFVEGSRASTSGCPCSHRLSLPKSTGYLLRPGSDFTLAGEHLSRSLDPKKYDCLSQVFQAASLTS
jgi:hypothetical protein